MPLAESSVAFCKGSWSLKTLLNGEGRKAEERNNSFLLTSVTGCAKLNLLNCWQHAVLQKQLFVEELPCDTGNSQSETRSILDTVHFYRRL